MNSKEALEKILKSPVTKSAKGFFIEIEELKEIKQDLDRLEELEEENENLLDNKLELVVKNKQQDMLITKLIQENDKLKKVIEILKRFISIKEVNEGMYFINSCVVNGLLTKEEYYILREAL